MSDPWRERYRSRVSLAPPPDGLALTAGSSRTDPAAAGTDLWVISHRPRGRLAPFPGRVGVGPGGADTGSGPGRTGPAPARTHPGAGWYRSRVSLAPTPDELAPTPGAARTDPGPGAHRLRAKVARGLGPADVPRCCRTGPGTDVAAGHRRAGESSPVPGLSYGYACRVSAAAALPATTQLADPATTASSSNQRKPKSSMHSGKSGLMMT